jgi:hypothetical protein
MEAVSMRRAVCARHPKHPRVLYEDQWVACGSVETGQVRE